MSVDDDLAAIDRVACAAQDNFGNEGMWFISFRRAMQGVAARQRGVVRHYRMLTEWLPGMPFRDYEYELASCLFCMDSALECMAFALNALGWGVKHPGFASMSDGAALKSVRPENILGGHIAGFDTLFPTVTRVWREAEADIRLIMNNHDVSKHRSATFWGGTMRADPPPQILRSLGLPDGADVPYGRAPMSSVLLPRDPKLPLKDQQGDLAYWCDLAHLKNQFDEIMQRTAGVALGDVTTNVKLAG